MSKTIQMKTTVVDSQTGVKTQVNGYPITTPDRVIDSNGVDVQMKLGNKADKVAVATDGHLAGLDANGNLTDSGKSASDFATSDVATTTTNGLMSSSDKAKLDGIENYVLPVASTNTLGGVKVGTNLSISDGVLSADAQRDHKHDMSDITAQLWYKSNAPTLVTTAEGQTFYKAWTSCAYGNGKFVAIAEDNMMIGDASIVYSDDGIEWSTATVPSGNWYAVVWGSDKFIAIEVDSNNKILVSSDGISWSEETLPNTVSCYSIVYGNGTFVILTETGLLRSADGVSWTEVAFPEDVEGDSLKFSNGKFILMYISSRVWISAAAISDNAIDWVPLSFDEECEASSIDYGNGKILRVTDSNVEYSTDGTTWTPTSLSTLYPQYYWITISYGMNKYVAVGLTLDESEEMSVGGAVVAYSDNCIDWTLNEKVFTGSGWPEVFCNNNEFVVAFNNLEWGIEFNTNYILKSSNGEKWTEEMLPFEKIPSSYSFTSRCVVFGNTTKLITDNQCQDYDGQNAVNSIAYNITGTLDVYLDTVIAKEKTSLSNVGLTNTVVDPFTWNYSNPPEEYGGPRYICGDNKIVYVKYGTTQEGTFSNDYGNTWNNFTFPVSTKWGPMAYGNNTFVIFSAESTTAVYSTNGITWELVTLPATLGDGSWSGITYANGLFVAISSGSRASVYSRDGITWQTSLLPTSDYWGSVTFLNDRFVAVRDYSNKLAYMLPDSMTWQSSTISQIENFRIYDIAYGDGKYVVFPAGSQGAYSTDLITWTPFDLPESRYWRGSCYGGGKFVVFGGSGSLPTYDGAYSTDGITWYKSNPVYGEWYHTYYKNRIFVTAGNGISYSFDGINWYSIQTKNMNSFGSGAIFGNRIMFLGDSDIAYSDDTSFEVYINNKTTLPVASSSTLGGIKSGSGIDIDANGNAKVDILNTTIDTWITSTLPSSAYWYSVTYGNGKFVAIDAMMGTAASTDGINWTASTLPGENMWPSVTYGNGKFVAVAMDSNASAYSTDGIEWTASTLPSESDWMSVTYGNGKFVAVAMDSNASAYSTDGIEWTASTLPSESDWWSVTYGDGKFVTVAMDSNASAYSTDGIEWNASTLPSENMWYSVTYGSGKFVAITTGSNISAYSTDGINWTASTLPSSEEWTSVTYGNGKFVAVAPYNAAAYSTDGINWTESMLPSENMWMSVTYGDGKFVAVAMGSNVAACNIAISFKDYTATSSSNGLMSSSDKGKLDGIEVDDNGNVKVDILNTTIDTWITSTLPSENMWYSVTYGNGKFVAVAAESNIAAYSTDGINWTQSTLPSESDWWSVTYGDGKFVTVAMDSNASAYSTDGINWTESMLPSENMWMSVTYGDGKFVVIATGNAAAYSTDGINWTTSTLPSDNTWISVTYGDGKFVVIAAESNTSAYSADGINWTASTLPSEAGWYSVTYGDSKFVAIAAGSNVAAYSADGITWTASTLPYAYWYSVTYGDGKFVAVATESNTSAYSTDGINWTASTLPSESRWRSVTYGDGKFVAVAYYNTVACKIPATSFKNYTATPFNNGLMSSTDKSKLDGINVDDSGKVRLDILNTGVSSKWNESELPSRANWQSVTYGNGKFVAITAGNVSAYSTDGINWIASTLPNEINWVSVTYGNGKFVTVAASSNVSAYSTDGINWIASTLPSSAQWHSVTYGNGKFVAIAGSYSGTDIAAYSTDGIDWDESELPSSANWQSVTYGNGKFVAIAYNSNVSAYSTDGIEWTASTLPSRAYWYTVTYGNGKFVAVENNRTNVSAYSTDGINWTASTLPSSAQWHSVTYGNGKFVAVAYYSNASAYSTDGITWNASTLPSESDWYSVTYGDGKFVAVAYNSNTVACETIIVLKDYTATTTDNGLMSSTDKSKLDGIEVDGSGKVKVDTLNTIIDIWTASTLPSSDNWASVTYGNGKFVAISNNSNVSAYSTDGINWTASTLPSTARWTSVTYGNGMFVAITAGSNAAAYSTDGITWTTSTLPNEINWVSVTYGNSKFVTVATDSNISAYSTDGITWNASTLPISDYWWSVTYGDGKFVTVACYSNAAAYSTDGINWTASTLPSSEYWRTVTYGDSKFVTVASYSNISAYSTDGINWTTSTLPSSTTWYSVTYGNGKFVAIAPYSSIAAYGIITEFKNYTATTSSNGLMSSTDKTNLNNKTDKVSNATNGHLAGLDASGNLTDSGKSIFDFVCGGLQTATYEQYS